METRKHKVSCLWIRIRREPKAASLLMEVKKMGRESCRLLVHGKSIVTLISSSKIPPVVNATGGSGIYWENLCEVAPELP